VTDSSKRLDMADNQQSTENSTAGKQGPTKFQVEGAFATGAGDQAARPFLNNAEAIKVGFIDVAGKAVQVRVLIDRLAGCEARGDSVIFLDPNGAAPPMRIQCLNEAVASSFARSLRIITTDSFTADRQSCVLAFDTEGYQVPVEGEQGLNEAVATETPDRKAGVKADTVMTKIKGQVKQRFRLSVHAAVLLTIVGLGAILYYGPKLVDGAPEESVESIADESSVEQAGSLSTDEKKLFDVATGFAAMSDEEFEREILSIAGDQSETGINKALHMTALREFGKKVASGEVSLDDLPMPNDPQFQANPAQEAPAIQPVVIQLSTTGEGAPIHVFADPQCPACQHYETALEAEIGKRPINILPVAILKGSDFVVDQILCSDSPEQAWRQYMKNKTLVERDLSQCPMLFAHKRNNEMFASLGLTQTPTSLFESIPGVAIVGSVIPADEEAKHQQNKIQPNKQ
jgi:hypothetical protein